MDHKLALSNFENALKRHINIFYEVSKLREQVVTLFNDIRKTIESNGKILLLGNGGSAADSQHIAAEMIVKYNKERKPLRALALTTDTSILTAHANDFNFDTIFNRQILALGESNDLLLTFSTSGNSKNVINAIQTAKSKDIKCWALTNSDGGKLNTLDISLIKCPSTETARVQEVHIFICHWICELLDEYYS